jgi:hypothetical protein
MDFKKHLEIAWSTTLSHIVALIIVTLVMLVVSSLTFGLLAPVTMAGYIQSIIQLLRERREPKVQDLFSQMNLFLPLLGFGVVVFIAVMIAFMFFVLPGFVLILALAFCCIYTLPLMTDGQLGVVEAVKESYAMARGGNLADHLAVVIITIGIMMVGGSTFLVGALFTHPLATVFLASVYLEKRGRSASPAPPPPPPPSEAA